MTPHEALSHVGGLRHETLCVHYWTFDVGASSVQVCYTVGAVERPYSVKVWPGPFLLGPHHDRRATARQTLELIKSIAVDACADTTAIDHALSELEEP
jgi:hypothetical protein